MLLEDSRHCRGCGREQPCSHSLAALKALVDPCQIRSKASTSEGSIPLHRVAGNAGRTSIDESTLTEEDRPPLRDVVQRKGPVADLHPGKLRFGQFRFGV